MNWLNDAHLTFEDAAYNPEPVTAGPASRYTIVDPNNPANLRPGVLNVGGGPTFQAKGPKGWALQGDLTFSGWDGHPPKLRVTYKSIHLNPFHPHPPFPPQYSSLTQTPQTP